MDHRVSSLSLPSFWTAPSRYPVEPATEKADWKQKLKRPLEGWKSILLGSWLNILLVMIPISWTLNLTLPTSPALKFIFSLLALVPLVKLHDLSSHELALRIGGSRAGLINASLSNIVSIVVAISALRKCHLSLVQSSLMGSMLSKLLLVLGLCFFAGGTRFSEQGFDPTSTQIHTSLLTISVGALFLPAAYHFSLDGTAIDIPEWQKKNILHMSHGVSVILLFIFQFWSHSHLYSDAHNRKSTALFIKGPRRSHHDKQTLRDYDDNNFNSNSRSILPPSLQETGHCLSYISSRSTSPLSSQFSLPLSSGGMEVLPGESTVRLIPRQGFPVSRVNSASSEFSVGPSTATGREYYGKEETSTIDTGQATPDVQEGFNTEFKPPLPRVGWLLAILVLIVVTVAASITADLLVDSMQAISATVSKEWIGFVLLPAVTSIAECMTAVNVSVKDQLSFSISVAVGSALQTALFVIPFLVSLAWVMGKPLSLLMDPFQPLVLYTSIHTMSYVVVDGKSNWLEGMILVCLYIIIAVSFWFYPGSSLPASLATCVA